MPSALADSDQEPVILSPGLVGTLERLSIVSRKRIAGRMAGDRRSPKKGAGIEFADFREYAPGDDFRRIDWNLYARSEKLFLKLLSMDEDRNVCILVDCSRSMGFGEPGKHLFALQTAAALAYLGLIRMDRVKLVALCDGEIRVLGPLRGRAQFRRALEWLGTLKPEGGPGLERSLKRFLESEQFSGVAILLSDLLEEGVAGSLRGFAARGFEMQVLQVLSPEDVNPAIVGDVRLVDSETGDAREVTVSSGLLARYRRSLSDLQEELRRECTKCAAGFATLQSDVPLESLFARVLPAAGMIE